MQRVLKDESTCVEYSLVLNNVAREYPKHYNTELLILVEVSEPLTSLNPINYAQSFHRMSKDWTPDRPKI